MKFDIKAARSAGYSDDEIAEYLATENKFDLGGALSSGYSASDVVEYLSKPAQSAPVVDTGDETARLAARFPAPERTASSFLPRPLDPMGIGSGTPLGARPTRAPEPVKEQPKATPYRDRREALDDAVNLLEEGYDQAKVAESFAQGGITFNEIVAHGQKRGSDYFKQQPAAPVDPEVSSLARRFPAPAPAQGEMKGVEPTAMQEASNLVTRGIETGGRTIDVLRNQADLGMSDEFLATRIAQRQRRIEAARPGTELQDNMQAIADAGDKGLLEAATAIAQNPTATLALIAESLIATAPAAAASIGGFAINPLAGIAASFGAGTAMEYGATIVDTMIDAGMNPSDPASVARALANPELMAKAQERGLKRGLTVGAFSALTAGVTTRFAKPILQAVDKGQIGRAAGLAGSAGGIGIVGDSVGEAAAQTVVGDPLNYSDILIEGLAGGPGSIADVGGASIAAVRNDPMRQIAREIDGTNIQIAGGADARARTLLDPNAYDPTLVSPVQTMRQAGDVGPNAPTGLVGGAMNFTTPDSPSAQAGLVPIVVPNVGTGDMNVSTLDLAGPTATAGGQLAGDLGGTGLGDAGLAGVDAGGVVGAGADGLVPVGGTTAPLGSADGQQPASVGGLQRVAERASDEDLLARTQAAIVNQEINNDVEAPQPLAGRRGEGYATEQDAEQGRAAAAAVLNTKATHDWRVEPMGNGRFHLVPYRKQQPADQTTQAAASASTFEAIRQDVQPRLTMSLRRGGRKEIKLTAPAPELESSLTAISTVLGSTFGMTKPVVVGFSDPDPKAPNGFEFEGTAFVNLASIEVNIGRTSLHEFRHIIEKIAAIEASEGLTNTPAQQFTASMDSIFDDIPEVSRRAYLEKYLRREELDALYNPMTGEGDPAAREARIKELINSKLMRSEMVADFMGNRAIDHEFLESLAEADPEGFAGFVQKWLKVIDNLIATLRGPANQSKQELAKVDEYVRDLNKAKMVAREALIAYRKGTIGQQQQRAAQTDGQVAMSPRSAGASLQQRVDNDFDALTKEYEALPGAEGGRVLDADIARELSPEYRNDRTIAPEIHSAVSSFIEKMFEQRVKARDSGTVVLMAGGGGAGKSSANSLAGEAMAKAHTVLDGTLSSPDKAARFVNMAMANGQNAVVTYIYRDPVEAFANPSGGVLARAMETGRVVPIYSLIKTHPGSSDTVRALNDAYAGDDRFKLFVVDNSRGAGNAVLSDLQNIKPVIQSGLKEKLNEAANEALAQGQISQAIYDATTASGPSDAGAQAQGQARDVGDRQEDAGSVQGRSGSVGSADPVSKDKNTTGAANGGVADTRTNEGLSESAKQDGQVAGADGGREIPSYGKQREGAVSVVGRHYSTQQRQSLNGAYYGRGLKGAEATRLASGADSRLRSRVYFYVDQGAGIRPESGVGGFAHEVRLDNIYDPASRLIPPQPDANAFELAVIEAGFDGYTAPFGNNQSAAVLLGPKHLSVPVSALGQVASAPAPEAAAPTTLRKGLMSRELNQIDAGNIPGARVTGGNLVVPADQTAAANAELERIGSDVRFSKREGAITAASIEENFKLAQSRSWQKGRDLKVEMQRRVLDSSIAAGLDVTTDSPETRNYLREVGMRDALVALRQNPNAIGWYDLKTRQALAVMALVHPEIARDENARFAFTWALAVTSNGLKVGKNFEIAEKTYSKYKSTGTMPSDVGVGTAGGQINDALALFNELRTAWGMDNLRKFMQTNFTVSEITGISRELKPGGEHADVTVKGAAIIGPKIGNGFFSNLYGNFDSLTMDRWLVRTWGRWTATLIKPMPEQTAKARDRLEAVIKKIAASPEEAARLADLIGMAITAETDSDQLSAAVQKASMDPGTRAKMNETETGTELRKAGNSLAKYLDGQKEAPGGPDERKYIRAIFGDVLSDLRKTEDYKDLTMADLQAVLWYAEKRLYETAKTQVNDAVDEDVEGYSDDEAPDYANAAASVARDAGISDKKISSTIRRIENERSRAARDSTARSDEQGQDSAAGQPAAAGSFTRQEKRKFIGERAILRARANRAGDARQPGSYERDGGEDGGRVRVLKALGVSYTNVWKVAKNVAPIYRANDISTPEFLQLAPTPENAAKFQAAIAENKSTLKFGAAVYVYPAEEYQGMRLLLSSDGDSGVAIKPDGDIVSVFSTGGAGRAVMEVAVAAGGRKLVAFETILPKFYAPHGFRAVARTRWNDEFAPSEWSKDTFSEFNGGEPDVVFMVYDPAKMDAESSPKDGRVMQGEDGYDRAVAAQTREMRKVKRDNDLPDAPAYSARQVPSASIVHSLGTLNNDPDYASAKAGNIEAAARLANRLVTKEMVDVVNGFENPIIVGVASVESAGRNRVPLAAAARLGSMAGAEVDTEIVQSNSPKRTTMSGLDRILSRPTFDGNVQPGRNYVLVDDTITQGGTFASLADHITQRGGNVSAVMSLSGKAYSATISPDDGIITSVISKFGDVENEFKQATGYGFDGLTQSEARYLANYEPASAVRDRFIAAAEQVRSQEADAAGSRSEVDAGENNLGTRDGGRGQGTGRAQAGQVQASERAASQEALSPSAPLPGAPRVQGFTGPDPRLVSVAEQYARDNGITLRRQAEYVQVDPERAARIAQAYAEMQHAPQDPVVKEAYEELIRQTMEQYKALEAAGYTFSFFDDATDPYKGNPWNAMRDLRANQRMAVYTTLAGFGSSPSAYNVDENPTLVETGLRWPDQNGVLQPVLANDLFRAVHDAFGHGLEGAGFRADGEENAWQAHRRLFTGSAVAAMTSGTRGQNSWLNYGPNGEANRNAKVEDTVFADQKTGLMPEWTWTEGVAGDMPAMSARQTETPAFKRWFGDSKVVDAEGKPLVVYHGTQYDFDAFDPEMQGDTVYSEDIGFFFSNDPVEAGGYATLDFDRDDPKPNVMPVFLSIQNPKIVTLENEQSPYDNPALWYDNEGRDAAEDAMEDGFDGLIVIDNREDMLLANGKKPTLYVAFEPTQIKSATGNSGAFDPENPDIRYSDRQTNALGLYSELAVKLDAGPAQAVGEQWMAYIKGLTTKGVKQDEITWSGVEEWIKLQDGKIKKQDIVDYVNANGVQVEEVVLGDITSFDAMDDNQLRKQYERIRGYAPETGDGEPLSREDMIDELDDMVDEDNNETRYGQYTLPGGKNYREVLITLPSERDKISRRLADASRAYFDAAEEFGAQSKEAQAAKLVRDQLSKDFNSKANYQSSHWSQANVLAHLRLNDRADANGDRVLFVEEIQSDWGQDGKKKGFKGKTQEDAKKFFDITDADWEKASEQDREAYRLEMLDAKGRDVVPAAPFVTKTDAWLGLALKRVVTIAADGGYDKVAFVNGQQSADRYSLRKQVEVITATKKADGKYTLLVETKNGQDNSFPNLDPQGMEDTVGKEMAQKIVDATSGDKRSTRFSGLDLEVGGQGMITFYDKIVPNAVNALLKKVSGGKMGVVSMGEPAKYRAIQADADGGAEVITANGNTVSFHDTAEQARAEARRLNGGVLGSTSLEQPGFDVTDKMRDAAAQGLPMFSQRATVGQNFTLPSMNKVDRARRVLQDDSLRMKRVIEAVKAKGGVVGEAQNFYNANTLMPGRVQAAMDEFKDNVIAPLAKKAAEYDIDFDELALYAYAKHARERNYYIASINKRFPDGGSGMKSAEANRILKMVAASGKQAQYDDMHGDLMAITATTRQTMLTEGLITPDEFDQLENAYEFYIPLRGLENVDEDTGAMRPGIGRGVNVRGNETLRALGRKSRAGDLIENAIRDYQRVINRVEKNDVGKVLLDFVLSNPDPDLWGVDVERSTATFNKTLGTVQYTSVVEKGEDTIGVKVGGQQVYIKFADKDLTRALRQAWKDEVSGLERTTLAVSGWWNNWMRGVLTRYNPLFAAINIPRDALWSGTTAALADLGPKGLGRYLLAYGKAMMAASRQQAGIAGTTNKLFGNPVMDKMFQEFRAAGGVTGGFYMKSLDDINTDLRTQLMLAGANPKGIAEIAKNNLWNQMPLMSKALQASGMSAVKANKLASYVSASAVARTLEFLGSASENATRFALYMAARDTGKTPAEAGLLAKNGTTNFNRKGEWGGALNNMYLFYNAAVQGTSQLLYVLKSPAVRASMAGVAGVGAMLAFYGAAAGGEDDDGEAYWDKIPSHVKERNLVIMLPPGDALGSGMDRVGKRGRYILIPVQYGFNIFPNMGYMIADVIRNQQDPRRGVTPTKAALHMTSVVVGSINPFGGAVDLSDGVQVLLALAPTLADLPIQLINERGTFGTPSAPDKSPWDVHPDSERMYPSQMDGVPASIAKVLNELGGGNEAKAGSIMGVETSVTPGTIQTIIAATTGGLGNFAEQVASSVVAMSSDDKDLKAGRIPFVNRFYGEVDEDANIRKAGDRMREVKKISDTIEAQFKLGMDVELSSEDQRILALAGAQDDYQKAMGEMRKEEIAVIKSNMTEPEKKLVRQQIKKARDELATVMNRVYIESLKQQK
jgi:orotate phosphoribosyltransferase-like protein